MRGKITNAVIGAGAGMALVWFITSLIQSETTNMVISALLLNLFTGGLFAMLRGAQGLDKHIIGISAVLAISAAALAASQVMSVMYEGKQRAAEKDMVVNIGTVVGGLLIFAGFWLGEYLLKLLYRFITRSDDHISLLKADYVRQWFGVAVLLGGLVGLLL